MSAGKFHILYLVHNLSDPAVEKRVRMMRDGGALVTIAGFRRAAMLVTSIAGCPVVDFGRTYDGVFIQRIAAILKERARLARHRSVFASANIVIARNLEMLALAVKGCEFKNPSCPLIYESLDIHRLLLNDGLIGRRLRALEGNLSRHASSLITSSPAYIDEYFDNISHVHLPAHILENKVYLPENHINRDIFVAPRPSGPPWRIGWFGGIRCRESLLLLQKLATSCEGRIEIIIRGYPARDQIPDFDHICHITPAIHYGGPYKSPEDLPALYNSIHFTWAIDMYEAGQNGDWCLPNRIYEGGLHNAVPLAQKNIETGRFLSRIGTGVTFAQPLAEELENFFRTLTVPRYRDYERQAAAVPSAVWRYDRQDAQDFAGWLHHLATNNIIQESPA